MNTVFAGIKGQVIALEKTTGREVWRTRLKRADFVNIVTDGKVVFAATSGEVFCLDVSTGAILWNNPMKGLGLGLVSLQVGGNAGENVLLGEESRRARSRQAAAAT